MAKKKLNKAQRKEQRLRKARQWIDTYKGTPKKIVKHYKERFHVDTVCALKDQARRMARDRKSVV